VSEPPPEGHIRHTGAGILVSFGALAMIAGWLLRPIAERVDGTAPVVTWLQVLVLFFVAGLVAITAGVTWRSLQVRREWLEPHRAVNRLVMAKASALAGALMSGGYVGYAVSWLGLEAELAGQRVTRSLLAGLAGLLVTIAALVLERACRANFSDDGS
jgi:hypothetical protein